MAEFLQNRTQMLTILSQGSKYTNEKSGHENSLGESSAVGGASNFGGPLSMGTGPVASGLLDATALANIINQAKGTILSRI